MQIISSIHDNIRKTNKKNHLIIIILLLSIAAPMLKLSKSTLCTDHQAYRQQLLSNIMKSSDFETFQDELFKYEVTTDSLTTAYNIHNPQKYNIPELTPLLTDFSSENYAKETKKGTSSKIISKINKKMDTFSYDNLSLNDRVTYDLIKKHLKSSKDLYDYAYYETLLGKTTGAAANLPVILSEYPLNDVSDIETYLSLLKQIPRYFDSIIEYENERTSRKMATPTFILKDTEKELSHFIKSLKTDNNCFVTTFYERTKHITNLTKKDRSKYISNNKYYLNQYITPSYEKILRYIHSKTSLTNDKNSVSQSQSENSDYIPDTETSYGLCSYEGGKNYYRIIVYDSTGSDKTIPQLIELTENKLNNALSDIYNIAVKDTDAYMYYCEHPLKTGYQSPEGILEALSLMIRKDYPPLNTPFIYKVKTVPGALAEMVSPAFYMIPAIDDYENNTIYINPLYTSEENGNLFTTLAHEGFPGHLYQTLYFNSLNPAPIRQILDYPGYVEGWATYVELNSFSFINYSKYENSLPTLYRLDTIINLAISSRIDMGVNYEGWTLNDTCRYFEDLGFSSYYASDIYSYVVEAPGNYLSYFIGYMEIEDIKQDYKNIKMENYNEKDFHKALLDIGPGDFETIRKYILNP